MWYVYIIRCEDDSLYTGITTNINRRFAEHISGKLGAKYTRANKPKKIVYQHTYKTRSEASQEEARIKKLSKSEKEKLLVN